MSGDVTDLANLTDAAAGLEVSGADGIAFITLTRPQRRNAMTPSMWHGLARIGRNLPPAIRVVVVRGAGPSFCAGIDLRMFTPEGLPGEPSSVSPADPGFEDQIAEYQAGFSWLRSPQFVSIAAVQGHAIGAGFQLALACDLRVLADNAMLCMKEPALGLVPDLTGTKPLVEAVGLARAIELCLTARTVDAQEAARLGLAELVVPNADLGAAVSRLAAALLTTDAAAARETKALLMRARTSSLDEQAAAERAAQARLLRAGRQDLPPTRPDSLDQSHVTGSGRG
ncbi:MAG: enoyl-CoA hydratase/isomerase family protein [Actinobacteria bacterium]|nr:enoyl-CoA hydratase/isomerase family protein [Actinomycetota bacterium]